tara:strand:+ start:401 stop:1045 length:645 start_codon:yes stop_codon:yes gene_type:complete
MHQSVKNLNSIYEELRLLKDKVPSIIAVSKTFPVSSILPLIKEGHIHFGENKVQEAVEKWSDIKKEFNTIKLHMIGKLQTNKVKYVLPLFDFIHSLDNEKLAIKISNEQKKHVKKPKIFIQVNIGEENQKSGIMKKDLKSFYNICKNLNLDIVGLMCIPPFDNDPQPFFHEMNSLLKNLKLNELSMGMSKDYLLAVQNSSTYIRIGSKIFGDRI